MSNWFLFDLGAMGVNLLGKHFIMFLCKAQLFLLVALVNNSLNKP